MSSEENKVYVIKKIKKIHKGGHHGGAWKIAYADFVTAMMSFFLLMWLLSLLNKSQLEAVSAYFKKPLKAAFTESGAIHMNSARNKFAKPVTLVKTKLLGDKNTGDKEHPYDTKNNSFKALAALQKEMEEKLEKNPELKQFKNMLNFQITAEGLKISLHDLENKSMFTSGKTDFQNYANKIMDWLGASINQYPNQVEIIGHTDSTQYPDSAKYGNWELSADRANATRRALVNSGMDDKKIVRIIGVGDVDPQNPKKLDAPENRRIEIIILSDKAMQNLAK